MNALAKKQTDRQTKTPKTETNGNSMFGPHFYT